MTATQIVEAQVEQLPLFDYSQLSETKRYYILDQTQQIKSLIQSAAAKIVEIGQRLQRVKSELEHGAWGPWLNAEFQWSPITAQRYIRVAEAFGQCEGHKAIDRFAPTALYELVAGDSSQEAIDEAIARAEGGEFIDARLAEQIKEQTNGEWLRPQQTSLLENRKGRSPSSPPPDPKFAVGDRVTITLSEFDKAEAEITLIDPKRNASQWMYEVSFTDSEGKRKSRTFYESALTFPGEENAGSGKQRAPRKHSSSSNQESSIRAIALEGRLQALQDELDEYDALLSELYTNCSRLNKEYRALVMPGDLGDRIESLLHPQKTEED